VHKKLRIFPYAQYIIEIYVSLAFQKCTHVQGQCWGLQVICKNVTVTSALQTQIILNSNVSSKVLRNVNVIAMATKGMLSAVRLFCAVGLFWASLLANVA